MTKESLIGNLIDLVGRTNKERRSRFGWLSPENVFANLEEETEKSGNKSGIEALYASRKSHAGAIRRHYPDYVKLLLKGTAQNEEDTEDLFRHHGVEFNDDNYEIVVAAVLAEIDNLADDELSVTGIFKDTP